MQAAFMVLVMLVFVHDAFEPTLRRSSPDLPQGAAGLALLIAIMILPKLMLTGMEAWSARRLDRALGTPKGAQAMKRHERVMAAVRLGVLGSLVLDLWAGALWRVRDGIGDWVLLDEAAVLAGPVLVLGLGWWWFWPVEKRLRETALIRRLDEGLPVYPVPGRGRYVWEQIRVHGLTLLTPLLVILAWIETAGFWLPTSYQVPATVAGGLLVFLLSPLLLRLIWDTVPLPKGETRDRLEGLCLAHRVRVARLLLWRTGGVMCNAAVVGFIAPVRYILMTDALLEALPSRTLEAVMAHEIGHIRLKHLWRLGAAAMGLFGGGYLLAYTLLSADPTMAADQAAILAWVLAGLGWWLGFGWVSRRIEWQADAFAVKHFAKQAGREVIAEEDASAMSDALKRVAGLGQGESALQRRNWRHGSIAMRIERIDALIGRHVNALPIDTTNRRVLVVTLLVIGVLGTLLLAQQV